MCFTQVGDGVVVIFYVRHLMAFEESKIQKNTIKFQNNTTMLILNLIFPLKIGIPKIFMPTNRHTLAEPIKLRRSDNSQPLEILNKSYFISKCSDKPNTI
jgi:hypothetical protein